MKIRQLGIIGILLLAIGIETFAQEKTPNINVEDGLAIDGYDPVAYFVSGKAVEGKKDLTANVGGVVYRFSSASNRDLFQKDPQKYEPQYGGWCAYAMGATGEKVEIDPETFKIIDNKLYLFYNAYFNNTLKKWNTDEPNLKKKADDNWKKATKQ